MTRSLNEIHAMAKKAAIGADIPLGQADDLADVAIYLAGTRQGLRCVADALAEPAASLDVRWDSDRIVVRSGAAAMAGPVIRDAFEMGVTRAVMADPAHGDLIVAMLAAAGIGVQPDGDALVFAGPIVTAPRTGPAVVPDDIWRQFQTLAARTYVPESEGSRATGAGAGLTDND